MDTGNNSLFWSAVEKLKGTHLSGVNLSDGCAGHAKAHNFLFDARAGGERERHYHRCLNLQDGLAEALLTKHTRYIEDQVQGTLLVPPTFTDGNQEAFMTPLDASQSLVRLEVLDDFLREGVPENARVAEIFDLFKARLTQFNAKRDNRPMFAVCEEDVADTLSEKERANALCIRLGLAHVFPTQGEKVYVALMRYSVEDVLEASRKMPGVKSAFAAPTVLDTEMNEYFFPAPIHLKRGEHKNCGRSMPLRETGQLTAELLHVKFDYRPEHLYKLGVLDAPLPDHSVCGLRNFHLLALQLETELYDFGEEIFLERE